MICSSRTQRLRSFTRRAGLECSRRAITIHLYTFLRSIEIGFARCCQCSRFAAGSPAREQSHCLSPIVVTHCSRRKPASKKYFPSRALANWNGVGSILKFVAERLLTWVPRDSFISTILIFGHPKAHCSRIVSPQ